MQTRKEQGKEAQEVLAGRESIQSFLSCNFGQLTYDNGKDENSKATAVRTIEDSSGKMKRKESREVEEGSSCHLIKKKKSLRVSVIA